MTSLVLPPNVALRYLAEGAANIVFRLDFRPTTPLTSEEPLPEELEDAAGLQPTEIPIGSTAAGSPLNPIFERKLLRLRKVLAGSPDNHERDKTLKELFFPIFPPGIVLSQDLVTLPPGLLQDVNSQLRDMEAAGTRPKRRVGVFLDESEQFGFLVEDMSPGPDEVMIEFKPKWLVQSPSAPPNWRRCRTCALLAKNNAAKRNKVPPAPTESRACPFDLVSGDVNRVLKAVQPVVAKRLVAGGAIPGDIDTISLRIAKYLSQSSALLELSKQQAFLDKKGVLEADFEDKNFIICMTLRDCTFFIKVPANENELVIGKVGDSDLKSPEGGKGEYWRGTEETLIRDGWYTGTEEGAAEEQEWCR